MNKLAAGFLTFMLGTGAVKLAEAQESEILNPRSSSLEEVTNNDNYNYYNYGYYSDLGIQGRTVNLIVDGKFYSVNVDEPPEYDDEGNMISGSWKIGPERKNDYISPYRNYSDTEKAYKWGDVARLQSGELYHLLKEGRIEESEQMKEKAIKSFAKTVYFMKKAGIKRNSMTEFNFIPVRDFEKSIGGFIAQVAEEAYDTYGEPPPMTTKGIAEKHVQVPAPNIGDENFLGRLLFSIAGKFVQEEGTHKEEINKEKAEIEKQRQAFRDYQIFDYQTKIIEDLKNHLKNLSTDELFMTLVSEEDFSRNLTMPLWSRYLSCSPKWSVLVYAISELEYYQRTLSFIENKNFNFNFEEMKRLIDFNFEKILEDGFAREAYIDKYSRKPATSYIGYDGIYVSIEKRERGGKVYTFPKDRDKVDKLKKKQPDAIDGSFRAGPVLENNIRYFF